MSEREREHIERRLAAARGFLRASVGQLVDEHRDRLAAVYGRRGVYAVGRRQLGKRELRRIDALPRMLGSGDVR